MLLEQLIFGSIGKMNDDGTLSHYTEQNIIAIFGCVLEKDNWIVKDWES